MGAWPYRWGTGEGGRYPGRLSKRALAAQRIEDEEIRARAALASIAEAQAKAGDIRGALATAQRIEDEEIRAGALINIAEAQLESGTR